MLTRLRSFSLATITALVLAGTVLAAPAAVAAPTVIPTVDALELGRAIAADLNWVVGAGFVQKAGASSTALVEGGVAGFPVSGERAALLSTGDASIITTANSSGSSGSTLSGFSSSRGNSAYDVTVLRVDLNVPPTANCLVGMDFRFLSEEYPEYVGSRYNDAFIAELDRTTWTTSGSTISAPDNFAFDPTGSPITINAAGETSMGVAEAAGTTFDGATAMLTAAVPLTPGAHSLYLSIFDQGDSIYDSAVIIDNLRLGRVGNPADDCRPGAVVVDRGEYVALGDSYSSGFGVSPYLPGTNKDGTENDCQRSTLAYSQLVADARDLELHFHACQGGVTKDFYHDRNSTWGEVPQLDHLTEDTGLVTLSVGGNDTGFADVLAECILGMELLPFNTCYKDDKVTEPVAAAIARLDGETETPADIVPYAELYGDIRDRAPVATVVAVGYPHFYTAEGSDRTFLPGGRCEGMKKADQRWIVEKIDELNGIIEDNAHAMGFLYAEPDFSGHELCSGGDEWIFGLLDGGRMHPTADGQAQMSEAVLDALDADGFERFQILSQERITYTFEVGPSSPFISLVTGWPGSDVSLALQSPSGIVYDRATQRSDLSRVTGPTYERVRVTEPEAGTWTAVLVGEDVPAAGEPVTLSVYVAEPENERPTARVALRVEGGELVLDASGSTDPDGTLVGYDWYVSSAEDDTVLQGAQVRVPAADAAERTFTLVVTDDRGLTSFAEVRWIPVDVKPGSDVNPIKLSSAGVTPLALLSTATFDATGVSPLTVRVGPGAAHVREAVVSAEDVNGDGLLDQVLHVPTAQLGLRLDATQLCVIGDLPDGESFTACDRIRAQ